MTTDQIIEIESADEKNYANVCTRITHLNVQIEDAERACAQHHLENPIPTPAVRSRAFELEGELTRLLRERQNLLPAFADLHSKIHGWS